MTFDAARQFAQSLRALLSGRPPPAATAPPAQIEYPPPIGHWSSRANQSDYGEGANTLVVGRRYRVRQAFTDHDRDMHPVGEEWTFLGHAFVPYHDGLSWFVSFDGVREWHIRMQCHEEEQGPIAHNIGQYVEPV
jgi:hypothetical protein